MTQDFDAFPAALQAKLASASSTGKHTPKRKNTASMPSEFTTPVKDTGFTSPSSDPEGISVGLPSKFAFYEFKDLYVKPFRARHLAKLAKAHEERSLLPMVEAVSSVLSTTTPVDDALGFKLSVADFYFVLYWLKFNSFTDAQLTNTTYCVNPAHVEEVRAGSKPEESLKIVTVTRKGELEVNYLEATPNPSMFPMPPGFSLRPATMQDTVEFMEHPDWLDPEIQYLGKLASVLRVDSNPNMSLTDRIKLIDEQFDADTCHTLIKYEEYMDKAFGVAEKLKVTCNGCGASRVVKLTLDAHSFLSAPKQD